MGVGTADAKRGDSHRSNVGMSGLGHAQRQVGPRHELIRPLRVRVGWHLAMVRAQRRLDQRTDAGGGVHVP